MEISSFNETSSSNNNDNNNINNINIVAKNNEEDVQSKESKQETTKESGMEIYYRSMTVVQLRKLLKDAALSSSGRKEELIQRLVAKK